MRLDKFIGNLGYGSRKEIHKYIKDGIIDVNGIMITEKNYIIKFGDIINIGDNEIEYKEFIYLILNKPNGYVSSKIDESVHKSYLHLLDDCTYLNIINPVGRLDFDTEGLLFLTNDGDLTHRIINSKKDIFKKYYVEIEKELSARDIHKIENGLKIEDYITKKATLEIIGDKKIYLSISEGKFHQVKKMLEAVDNKVLYLKRYSIGTLLLGDLELGKWKYLNEEEINKIKKLTNS